MRHRVVLGLITALAAASLAADAEKPAHLKLADRMVEEISPANNQYKNGKFTVTWAGINGATVTKNESDCTTYVTALLHTAYHYTPDQFKQWFGVASPSIGRYYDAAIADQGVRAFKKIDDVRPGDLLISKYAKGASGSAAGHMMIVDAKPVATDHGSDGLKSYDITILDCSADPHANDSRGKKVAGQPSQSGIGRGTMQVYVDANGDLVTWSWSAGRRMIRYSPDQRPITFAKVPVPDTDR